MLEDRSMMNSSFIDSALTVELRETKLPRWAQDKIDALRRATTEAVAELKALKEGTKPASFYLEDWDGNGRYYLPDQGRLQVDLGENRRINLHVVDGKWLRLMGEGVCRLIAAPQAANVLHVTEDDDR